MMDHSSHRESYRSQLAHIANVQEKRALKTINAAYEKKCDEKMHTYSHEVAQLKKKFKRLQVEKEAIASRGGGSHLAVDTEDSGLDSSSGSRRQSIGNAALDARRSSNAARHSPATSPPGSARRRSSGFGSQTTTQMTSSTKSGPSWSSSGQDAHEVALRILSNKGATHSERKLVLDAVLGTSETNKPKKQSLSQPQAQLRRKSIGDPTAVKASADKPPTGSATRVDKSWAVRRSMPDKDTPELMFPKLPVKKNSLVQIKGPDITVEDVKGEDVTLDVDMPGTSGTRRKVLFNEVNKDRAYSGKRHSVDGTTSGSSSGTRKDMKPKQRRHSIATSGADRYVQPHTPPRTDSTSGGGSKHKVHDEETLTHYYDTLAANDQKLKKADHSFTTTHCPRSTLKRSKRRRLMALEAVLKTLPSFKDRLDHGIQPDEILRCSYLRLSKNNIEELEDMCRDIGVDPGVHIHMTQRQAEEYFERHDQLLHFAHKFEQECGAQE